MDVRELRKTIWPEILANQGPLGILWQGKVDRVAVKYRHLPYTITNGEQHK